MQLAVSFQPQFLYDQMVLLVNTKIENIVAKLYAALEDGRLKQGPYNYLDGEIRDDNGVSWVNAEVDLGIDRWCGIGADDETGELSIAVGLLHDELDGTAAPITDPEAYWPLFVAPLKKLLAIIQ